MKRLPVVDLSGQPADIGFAHGIMAVVAEVMRLSLNDVAVGTIRDPEAVQKIIEDGMGSCLTLQLGAKKDMPSIGRNGEPLEVTGIVKVISHFPARPGYENLGFFFQTRDGFHGHSE